MNQLNIYCTVFATNLAQFLFSHNPGHWFSTNLSIVWGTFVSPVTTEGWFLNCLVAFHCYLNFARVKAGVCMVSAGTINPKTGLAHSPLLTVCARACSTFWLLWLGNKAMLVLAWSTVLSSQSKPNFVVRLGNTAYQLINLALAKNVHRSTAWLRQMEIAKKTLSEYV